MTTHHFTEIRSQAEALWREGVQLLYNQQCEEAVHHLRQSACVDPSFAPAFNDLGVLMEALGNREQALVCYRAALRAEPNHQPASENLALLMLQMDLAHAIRYQSLRWQPAA
jgi:Flp pilus assembly protein TadD